jgi:hypothetical protein
MATVEPQNSKRELTIHTPSLERPIGRVYYLDQCSKELNKEINALS